MITVSVEASKNYDIIIGEGLLDKAGGYIKGAAGGWPRSLPTTSWTPFMAKDLRPRLRKWL